MVEKTEIARPEGKRGRLEVERLLHPIVFVIVSLLIAIGAFGSDFDALVLSGDAAAVMKLIGGALFLVLIALFFQQRAQIRQARHERERHFAEASDELRRMNAALRKSTGSRN